MSEAKALALLWNILAGGDETPQTVTKPIDGATVIDGGLVANLPVARAKAPITVRVLIDNYLAWLAKHRSAGLRREAKRHLDRFAERHGRKAAIAITGIDLENFQDHLIAQGHALSYVRKHAVSLRSCYNKGIRMGWLPLDCKPFVNVEGIRLDPDPLLESDLPTKEEVRALIEASRAKPKLHAMLLIYHATGCRTHELLEARVGDLQPGNRTLVLGRHKRSKTLRDPIPRTITLNAVAYDAISEHCRARAANETIFPNRAGKVFTSVLFDDMFSRLRKKAGVREGITPYSFRHLYISEMLMAGVDALMVAKVAGTSVKMVEKVYGHFKTASFHEAQAKLDAARTGGIS